ncbi:MAG: hypothetical protein N2201_05400 [candidate division WOR-3 bacterium]|nr:hypothetical protein [candidate division WOR-3 bacterium]
MKASFPHLGYDTLALKGFLENLGAEVIVPPPLTDRTISLGTKYSPELICLPFKITLGNFIESLELGADTLFMAAGARKCRFGYYHYLQEKILKQLGNGFKFYAISQYTPLDFVFQKMPKIFSISPKRVIHSLYLLIQHSKLIEEFRNLVRKGRILDYSQTLELEKKGLKIISEAKTLMQIRNAHKQIKSMFGFTKLLPPNTIRVGLVGEIYLMLENFANHEIEKELSKLGIYVLSKRSLYRHLKHLLYIDWQWLKYRYLAYRYLKDSPGGEAINTVGEARAFIRQGVSGIIHIFPFTCMPENIALEVLQKMSEDYSVPILSLSFDEHTSKTGLLTRIEAFVDLLKHKSVSVKSKGK